MIRKLHTVAAAFGALVLSGCATMEGGHVTGNDAGGEGQEYFLPTGYFDLKIFEDGGKIAVVIGSPRILPDNAMRFRSRLLAGGGADNEFTIKVGPDGLLNSLAGTSEGKLTEIVTNLAKNAALIQSGTGETVRPFFNHPYRFSDTAQAAAEANSALAAYIAAACPPPKRGQTATARCEAIAEAVPATVRSRFITIRAEQVGTQMLASERLGSAALTQPGPRTPRDALFYHPLAPFQITLALANGQHQSDVYAVPDKSRIDWVRTPSGVFAKQEYDYQFSAGSLTSYKRVAKSEIVGLVSLPLEVVKAIISAPVEALNARKDVVTANSNYLAAVTKAAEEAQKARDACKSAPALCGPSVYRIIKVETPDTGTDDSSEGDGTGSGGTGSVSDGDV